MFSCACVRLRKKGFRSRQVTGCMHSMRRDLVEEISQTCGWSANVRFARDLE